VKHHGTVSRKPGVRFGIRKTNLGSPADVNDEVGSSAFQISTTFRVSANCSLPTASPDVSHVIVTRHRSSYPLSMDPNPPTETELKIPVPDLETVRRNLAGSTEAHLVHATEREVNTLLDTADGELAGSDRLLRLRWIGDRALLTWKGPARFEGAVKHREELEIVVADVEQLASIFERLGYLPVVRYEKDRESWQVGQVTVTLDHTPMGDFVELEGPADRLIALASDLGIDPGGAVRGSYISLWQDHRQARPELALPQDMVFEP